MAGCTKGNNVFQWRRKQKLRKDTKLGSFLTVFLETERRLFQILETMQVHEGEGLAICVEADLAMSKERNDCNNCISIEQYNV